MIKEWLHITYESRNGFIPRILGAKNNGKKNWGDFPDEISQLGLYLTTRMNFLPYIIERLTNHIKKLEEVLKTHEAVHINREGKKESIAFDINPVLIYPFLIDVDSLLFEINSCCELIKKYFAAVHEFAGKPLGNVKEVGKKIENVIEKADQSTIWFQNLAKLRNFFIHEVAPYVAVDISNRKFDLLITKKNLFDFDNEKDFFRYSELKDIVDGFISALNPIQKEIISLFS